MKGLRNFFAELSDRLDIPCAITAGLPCAVIDGFCSVSVDLQKGIISYSESEITVAVSLGRIVISGADLTIRLMKQERIIVAGRIQSVSLIREDDHV